ncbi:MAG: VirB8/TrbF family protein [Rickettsiaceae bacterium]|nr:VirB8/TrbF family protein [Rickettsiaceae bacterium]
MKKKIESGEYFKEAIDWYNKQYLEPFCHRTIFFLIFLYGFTLFVSLFITLFSLFPVHSQVQYAVYVRDESNLQANIIPIENTKTDQESNIVITKIFLSLYVEKMEGYVYEQMNQKLKFLYNTSTTSVYQNYKDYIDISNPKSPLIRFQSSAKRVIKVKSVTLTSDSSAKVLFNATTAKDDGKILENQELEADIKFTIDKIKKITEKESQFNFVVGEYNIKLIRDNYEKDKK